ncbi:MAG: glutathione S-transferase family protein [Rhodospirillaceae bacterium]|nr:glutathione S-transferase family protein [Rhodospirillaceae bacterium]
MPPPRLHQFRVSHYSEKARWALDHKGWPHARVSHVPGFHLPRVRMMTGQQQLPVLVFEDRTLCGSGAILAEIEHRRPDPPLLPASPAERVRAREIEAFFDADVAPDLRRLFWWAYLDHPVLCARMATDGFGTATRWAWRACFPLMRPLFCRNMGIDTAHLAQARAQLPRYFDWLEANVGPSGYLVGDAFTHADLCAAAVMTALVRPPEFPYPLPEPWPAELIELRESVAARPGFAWVLEIYRKHRGRSHDIAVAS